MTRDKIERLPVYVENGTSTPTEYLVCADDAVKRLEQYVDKYEKEEKKIYLSIFYALRAVRDRVVKSENITDDEAIDILALIEPLIDGLKKAVVQKNKKGKK